ncbi:hypothetical protein BDY19DRAFT_989588 [Irpex rosettiformis]|uniref:Uncharacterized protein n=1 Tax=Irpex rosettiformis TaxID=378272 RepID=A0ACB8UJ37_9APHY|nr:hypothetical protein BDY19DRAFT_989588 [Irpex rosettiformis]
MLFAALLSLAILPRAFGAQFNVTVGGPGILKFDPPVVNAAVGDVVLFTFKQKNHTATQSTFANPCQLAPNGFDSGFIPVADNDTGPFPAAQFIVEDTNPVWVYCRQANHCQQGMVFAINPGDKFAAFQANAMGTGNSQVSSVVSTQSPLDTSSATTAPPTVSSSANTQISSSGFVTSTTSPSTPSASSSSLSPSEHLVVVGGPNKLFFSPSNITANIGDVITFEFQQKNHTVTQSTFAQPCVGLTQSSSSGQIGFDSGFMPVSDGETSGFPTYKVTVNNSSPIWAFCRQANHCGQGMVFSVNAVESGPNNFAAFQAKAMQLNGTSSATSSAQSISWRRKQDLLSALAGVVVAYVVFA